jgi:uncharacterized protein YjbJ (UPF0337 family)
MHRMFHASSAARGIRCGGEAIAARSERGDAAEVAPPTRAALLVAASGGCRGVTGNQFAAPEVFPAAVPLAGGVRQRPQGNTPMNWDRIEGNWKEFKGKAKQQWGKLTDDDLAVIDGNREELEGRLQQHYGYAKDKASQEITNWLNRI